LCLLTIVQAYQAKLRSKEWKLFFKKQFDYKFDGLVKRSMLESLLSLFVDLFLYASGKIILPLVSFGKWRADIRKSKGNWLTGFPYFSRLPDGILYFSYEGTILVAITFWIATTIGLTLYF